MKHPLEEIIMLSYPVVYNPSKGFITGISKIFVSLTWYLAYIQMRTEDFSQVDQHHFYKLLKIYHSETFLRLNDEKFKSLNASLN